MSEPPNFIRFASLNVQGLRYFKEIGFAELFRESKVEVVAVQATHIKRRTFPLLSAAGFEVLNVSRAGGKGGGVAIICDKRHARATRICSEVFGRIETTTAQVRFIDNIRPLKTVMSAYIPPGAYRNSDEFYADLLRFVAHCEDVGVELLGIDCNWNEAEWAGVHARASASGAKFLQTELFQFMQCVNVKFCARGVLPTSAAANGGAEVEREEVIVEHPAEEDVDIDDDDDATLAALKAKAIKELAAHRAACAASATPAVGARGNRSACGNLIFVEAGTSVVEFTGRDTPLSDQRLMIATASCDHGLVRRAIRRRLNVAAASDAQKRNFASRAANTLQKLNNIGLNKTTAFVLALVTSKDELREQPRSDPEQSGRSRELEARMRDATSALEDLQRCQDQIRDAGKNIRRHLAWLREHSPEGFALFQSDDGVELIRSLANAAPVDFSLGHGPEDADEVRVAAAAAEAADAAAAAAEPAGPKKTRFRNMKKK